MVRRRSIGIFIGIAAIVLFIHGCGDDNPAAEDQSADELKYTEALRELIANEWRLHSSGLIGEETTPIPGTWIMIRFDAVNGEGVSGCNGKCTHFTVTSCSVASLSIRPVLR